MRVTPPSFTPTPASVTVIGISVSEIGSPAVMTASFAVITGGVLSTVTARIVSVLLSTPSEVRTLEMISVLSLTARSGKVMTPVSGFTVTPAGAFGIDHLPLPPF